MFDSKNFLKVLKTNSELDRHKKHRHKKHRHKNNGINKNGHNDDRHTQAFINPKSKYI